MKYYCKSSLSWGEDGTGDNVNIPDPLPEVREDWKQEVQFVNDFDFQLSSEYRYNMNVCTFGYSYAHWDWKRWEREIDWMALNGINMPLAFVGYELID